MPLAPAPWVVNIPDARDVDATAISRAAPGPAQGQPDPNVGQIRQAPAHIPGQAPAPAHALRKDTLGGGTGSVDVPALHDGDRRPVARRPASAADADRPQQPHRPLSTRATPTTDALRQDAEGAAPGRSDRA